MRYTVTMADMADASRAVMDILPKSDDGVDLNWMIDMQLRIALESLSAEIGVFIAVPEPQAQENPDKLPLESSGTLPKPLMFGVAVPYAAKATAMGVYPYKSMSEGGDSVTFLDNAPVCIKDYKGVYSRYKHLVTLKANKGV